MSENNKFDQPKTLVCNDDCVRQFNMEDVMMWLTAAARPLLMTVNVGNS